MEKLSVDCLATKVREQKIWEKGGEVSIRIESMGMVRDPTGESGNYHADFWWYVLAADPSPLHPRWIRPYGFRRGGPPGERPESAFVDGHLSFYLVLADMMGVLKINADKSLSRVMSSLSWSLSMTK